MLRVIYLKRASYGGTGGSGRKYSKIIKLYLIETCLVWSVISLRWLFTRPVNSKEYSKYWQPREYWQYRSLVRPPIGMSQASQISSLHIMHFRHNASGGCYHIMCTCSEFVLQVFVFSRGKNKWLPNDYITVMWKNKGWKIQPNLTWFSSALLILRSNLDYTFWNKTWWENTTNLPSLTKQINGHNILG